MRAYEFITELTFFGSQCKEICAGHLAGYRWARRNNITNPPQTNSPSFNKGATIAIQHMRQGRNPIGPSGVRGERGRFHPMPKGR
jgi:hypothetical protein